MSRALVDLTNSGTASRRGEGGGVFGEEMVASPMNNLDDSFLMHIFGYLDPIPG